MNLYYVSNNEQVEGPFTFEQIESSINAGNYCPQVQVCLEGTQHWLFFAATKSIEGQNRQRIFTQQKREENQQRWQEIVRNIQQGYTQKTSDKISAVPANKPTPPQKTLNKINGASANKPTLIENCYIVAQLAAGITVILAGYFIISGCVELGKYGDKLMKAAAKATIWSGIWILFSGLLEVIS
jgi:hypothetical protein